MVPFLIVRTFSTPLSPSCLQELLFDKRVVNTHYTEGPILEARRRVYHEEDQGPDLGELSREDAHKAEEGGLREMLWGATGAETGGKGVWVMCLIQSEDHCSQRGSERFSDPTSHFLDEKSESPGKGVLSIKPRTYPGSLTCQARLWHNHGSVDAAIRADRDPAKRAQAAQHNSVMSVRTPCAQP